LTPTQKSPLRTGIALLRHGQFQVVFQELRRRFFSERRVYGLCHELPSGFGLPETENTLTVRSLTPEDIPRITDFFDQQHSEDMHERIVRRRLVDSGVPTCYLVAMANGDLCSMQWLIDEDQNQMLDTVFPGEYPRLEQHEMMLWYIFMPRKYREKGILAYAISEVLKKAKKLNVTRVTTFIGDRDTALLEACKSVGFVPYLIRTERWRFFRKRLAFEGLSAGLSL